MNNLAIAKRLREIASSAESMSWTENLQVLSDIATEIEVCADEIEQNES